jgi:hypothetical protein
MKFASIFGALAGLASGLWAQEGPPSPPCAAAEFRQLDFWVGEWDVEVVMADGSTAQGENRVTRNEYGACVIAEYFRLPGGGQGGADYRGTSYSIYDTQNRAWRQMWVDSEGGTFDLRGGPVAGQRHVFELVTIEPRGPQRRLLRMIWEDVTADRLTWRWQRQDAQGWVDQWVLRYRRKNAADSASR